MDNIADAVALFFQSGIGVAIQILALIGMVIPGMKYLNSRFDMKIDKNIDKKVSPIITNLCTQLQELSLGLSTFQASTNTAIEYINRAIGNLETFNPKEERDPNHIK